MDGWVDRYVGRCVCMFGNNIQTLGIKEMKVSWFTSGTYGMV